MQIKKEIVAGSLYIASCYSAGFIPKQRPAQRAKRSKIQSDAKRVINATERRYYLMQLFVVNFKPHRDLFVELSFKNEPTEAEERNLIARFHRRMKSFYKKMGKQYRYILVRETHNRADEPVRQHYHIVCTGCGKMILNKIIDFWGAGGVFVRSLREFSSNFEDTCKYLLKERKKDNERAFRCSRNLKRPNEPLRRKIPENIEMKIPDGILVTERKVNSNDFGRYDIVVGKIIDQQAFDAYWAAAQKDKRKYEEFKNWRRYAKSRFSNW